MPTRVPISMFIILLLVLVGFAPPLRTLLALLMDPPETFAGRESPPARRCGQGQIRMDFAPLAITQQNTISTSKINVL